MNEVGRIFRIGDPFAVPIAWLAAFFLAVFAAGALLILFKLVLPTALKTAAGGGPGASREDLVFAIKFLAGWSVVVGLLAYANLWIWRDVYAVRIAPGGDWELSNPFGRRIASLEGTVERTVAVGDSAKTFWRQGGTMGSAYSVEFVTLFLFAQDGRVWKLSSSKSCIDLLAELGYPNLAGLPIETFPDGSFRIMRHSYGPKGPRFSPELLAKARFLDRDKVLEAQDMPGAYASADGLKPGDRVFAFWAEDGWWYPAAFNKADSDRLHVKFDDGTLSDLPPRGVRPFLVPEGVEVSDNYKGEGKYWACDIIKREGGELTVRYREDSSTGRTTMERLRIRPQGPGRL